MKLRDENSDLCTRNRRNKVEAGSEDFIWHEENKKRRFVSASAARGSQFSCEKLSQTFTEPKPNSWASQSRTCCWCWIQQAGRPLPAEQQVGGDRCFRTDGNRASDPELWPHSFNQLMGVNKQKTWWFWSQVSSKTRDCAVSFKNSCFTQKQLLSTFTHNTRSFTIKYLDLFPPLSLRFNQLNLKSNQICFSLINFKHKAWKNWIWIQIRVEISFFIYWIFYWQTSNLMLGSGHVESWFKNESSGFIWI